ncbi:hypothetical protein DEU56DRAFT_700311, partial [Suillus clintonianus]|uniref:uncharacterized protein n=1 Tax=Suillus clintonianus TaxID=1904413 RepID=UPI001B874956
GKVLCKVLVVYCSLLDFMYIAQYPSHDDVILGYIQDTLDTFHKHKDILIHLGIHDHLNIPKI